jgi:hypothetical protein
MAAASLGGRLKGLNTVQTAFPDGFSVFSS